MTRTPKVCFAWLFSFLATVVVQDRANALPSAPAETPQSAASAKQHIHPNPGRHRPSIFPLFHPELRYQLFDRFTHSRFCDPYGGSPASAAAEKRDAVSVFHKIQEDRPTFAAITQHLGLNGKRELSDDEKLAIYLQYIKLRDTVRLMPADGGYTFELLRRIHKPQQPGWGLRVIGVITPSGKINVVRTEPAPVYCPGSRQVD
jgi:hypothetical protein